MIISGHYLPGDPNTTMRQRPIGAAEEHALENLGIEVHDTDDSIGKFKLKKIGKKAINSYKKVLKKGGQQVEKVARRVGHQMQQHPELAQLAMIGLTGGMGAGAGAGLGSLLGQGGGLGNIQNLLGDLLGPGFVPQTKTEPEKSLSDYLPWIIGGSAVAVAAYFVITRK